MMRFGTGILVLAALAAGCAAGLKESGVADPAVARAALRNTAPAQPLRIVFDWRVREREGRFRGQGVARLQPPAHARIDLFGPRGEGLLSAALVDGTVRMPPTRQAVDVPPPAMMWAVLGVVAPPEDARLVSTTQQGARVRLDYQAGDGHLRYELDQGRLRGVRWDAPGNRRLTVELKGDAGHGTPARAVYRDWSGDVELVLDLKQVQDVDPYPPETWVPAR
ncbi:MAG TPA: hypothetical protein VJ957_11985 [Longimicrobiales bacterium]|nr:hypothetical protein [Longimicrobiales bacterium]